MEYHSRVAKISKFPLIMKNTINYTHFFFDTQIQQYLGNENSDGDHMKCSLEHKVLRPHTKE